MFSYLLLYEAKQRDRSKTLVHFVIYPCVEQVLYIVQTVELVQDTLSACEGALRLAGAILWIVAVLDGLEKQTAVELPRTPTASRHSTCLLRVSERFF